MPFVVIIRADNEHFLMGDNRARIIGFETNIEALEYYETISRQVGSSNHNQPPAFPKRNGFKTFAPSIIEIKAFKELVQHILPAKPEPLLISTGSESHVAITTGREAGTYWDKGRHRAFVWLRKGEHSANTKLKGREQEIIDLLQQGLKAQHIGKRLGVHAQTVTQHIQMMDLGKYRSNRPLTKEKHHGRNTKGAP